MRFLAMLLLPSMLTSCVLAPFFLDPQSQDPDDDPWWLQDDTGSSSGDDTENPYTRTFDPYAVFFSVWAVWDGQQITGHNLFANDPTSYQDAYITVLFVEEEYFNNYNGLYSCLWTGRIEPVREADFGGAVPSTRMWGAWEISAELAQTDCANFSDEWSGGDPTAAIQGRRIGIGYAPMTSNMRENLRNAVNNWGEDWDDYDDYVFSTYIGFSNDFGAWDAAEVDFTFAFEVNPEGGQVFGENGENVKIPVVGLDGPPVGLLQSRGWMGFYANVLLE